LERAFFRTPEKSDYLSPTHKMIKIEDSQIEITHVPDFWQQVRQANKLFLGLDYYGTLAPFEIDPMQAKPLPGIADLLRVWQAEGGLKSPSSPVVPWTR